MTIGATVNALEIMGVMNPQSPAAQILQFGTDLGLVIATAGANVLADLSLGLDVLKQVLQFSMPDLTPELQAVAKRTSQIAASQWWTSKIKPEQQASVRTFKDYQEGKISVFEMMGEIAQESPELFENYFPEMKAFIPPAVVTEIFTTTETYHQTGGLFGLASRDYSVQESTVFQYRTIQGVMDPYQLATKIADRFLSPILGAYRAIESQNFRRTQVNTQNQMLSIQDWAILSMFQPTFQTVDELDIRTILLNLQLTPRDLGYEILDIIADPQMIFVGSFNGVDPQYITKLKQHPKEAYIQYFDENGKINPLLKDKTVSEKIKYWGTYPELQNDPSLVSFNIDPSMLQPKTGYRNVRNFWSAASILDLMRRDPYFKNLTKNDVLGINPADDAAGYILEPDVISQLHRDLQLKSLGRKMNSMAKSNVADFFNTTSDKIRFLPMEQGKLAKIAVN